MPAVTLEAILQNNPPGAASDPGPGLCQTLELAFIREP